MKEETGVQEFARRLNLEAQEADRVYELIKRHQTAVINVAKLSDELNSFALKYNSPFSIEELTYIQNHFISDLGESWKKRIEVLRGGPDDYMEYLEQLLEEQRMKDEIKELQQQLTEKDATIEALKARGDKWERAFDNADRQYLKKEKEAADLRRKLEKFQSLASDNHTLAANFERENERLRKALEESEQRIKSVNEGIDEGPQFGMTAWDWRDWMYSTLPFLKEPSEEGDKQ